MVVCLGLMLVILFLNAGFVLAWIGDWARYMASRPSPVYILLAAILMATVPLLLIVPFARYRLQAAILTALMLTFFTVITLAHLNLYTGPDLADVEVEGLTLFIVLVLAWISPLILLSIAPAKDVSRRLIFLAIGLLLLIALNELSKLGLDVTAPKHQG